MRCDFDTWPCRSADGARELEILRQLGALTSVQSGVSWIRRVPFGRHLKCLTAFVR